MSKSRKSHWPKDGWKDKPNLIHAERMEREERRAIVKEKGIELTRFPYESVVDCAEFVANLAAVAGRAIRDAEASVKVAEDDKDAAFYQAEAQTWRGVKLCCKAIENGTTISP